MLIFPIGLKDATVNRIPWVCIVLALATLGVFIQTHYFAGKGDGAAEAKLEEVLEYWQEHPYLEPPEQFRRRLLPDGFQPALDEMREAAREQGQIPDDFLVEDQQRSFDRMCAEFLRLRGKSPFEQWALIPSRGFAQKGIIGYLFLHAGWLHLLGNLFFLYLVGPLLEDNWGRPLFLIFYLAGGVVAGAAQAALDMSSPVPVVGASGAVAACMGAFALRFTTRGVKMFYWFLFIFVGTFTVPAWLWTGFWLAREIAYFKLLGAGAQVAFMAHIGGFVFGAIFALALKLANFEKLFIQPGLEAKQGVIRQNPHVERGMAALHANQPDKARAAFQRALQEDPGNADAALGLARIAADAGDNQAATRAVGKALNEAASKGDDAAIKNILSELGPAFEPKALRPATAYRLAQRLEKSQPDDAVSCYRAAATGEGGALAGKALMCAAELLLTRLGNAREAFVVAQDARAADLTPDQQKQVDALIAEAGAGASPEYGSAHDQDVGQVPSLDLDEGGAAPSSPSRTFDPTAVDLSPAPASSAGGLELDLGGGRPSSSAPATVDPTAVDLDIAPSAGPGLDLEIGAPRSVAPDAMEIDLDPGASLPPAAPVPQPTPQPTAPAPQPAPAAVTPQPAPVPQQPAPPTAPPAQPAPTARAPGAPPSPTARAPGAPPAPGAEEARRSSREVVPLGKPVIEQSRFVGRFDNGLTVQMQQGAKVNLSFGLVSSIAYGVVDQVPGRDQRVLVLDIVLPPRQGALRVLRFFSDSMGLDKLYPAGTPPMEALRTLVFGLAERTTVRPPADAEKASRGDYPRFTTLAEYESTYYG